MKNSAFITTLLLVVLQWFNISSYTSQAWAQPRAWDGTVFKSLNGLGSKEDPYRIETPKEFAYIVQNFDRNLSICSHRYFKLMCDIDMQEIPWTFGVSSSVRRSFTSHLDGQGHKISNVLVNIDEQLGEYYVGLFSHMGGDDDFEAVIENLEIDGIRFVYGLNLPSSQVNYNVCLGGLVGKMGKNSRIENCIVRGFVLEEPDKEIDLPSTSTFRAYPIAGMVDKDAKLIASYGSGKVNASRLKGSCSMAETQGERVSEHDGYKWYPMSGNSCSFQEVDVDIVPVGDPEAFTFEAKAETKGKKYTYRWSINGEPNTTTTASIQVYPTHNMQSLAVELLEGDKVVGNDAYRIECEKYRIESSKVTKIGNTFTVSTRIKNQRGELAKESDFYFQWLDATHNYEEVGSSATLTGAINGHTYILLAQHRLNKNLEVSYVQTFCQPIYVCNQGISAEESKIYSIDGKSYAKGNDANDGRTPETAVRTLRRAYELLKPANMGGTTANNVIVIMGDYAENAFTETLDKKRTKRNSDNFEKNKPALITGQLNNFHSGRLLLAGRDIYLKSDICFTLLDFYGNEEFPMANIFACGNLLAMGAGLNMEGYERLDYVRGLIEGTYTPNFNIYGGWENMDDPDYVFPDNSVILIESGYYGRVIAGGSSQYVTEKTGSIVGTPTHPMRTSVYCSISNGNNAKHYQHDIALLVGGQTNGSCFANNTIEVDGHTNVGRLVGGNIGSGRISYITDSRGRKLMRPSDSFFGQTTINIKNGVVNELYGCSLGRFGHSQYKSESERDSCTIYFYGRSNINISGGIICNTLYGGGAGSVVGLGYNDDYHNGDPLVPIILSNGKVEYGPYNKAHNHLPHVMVSSDSLIDLNKSIITINISDKANLRGTLFGGGSTYSNQLPTRQSFSQAGNVYGDIYINISGGVLKGYVHGGGRGSLAYFDNQDGTGLPEQCKTMNAQGQVYGSTHIHISGGDIFGMVYGGGEGTYYRASSSTDKTNLTANMAAVIGTTHVTISGNPRLHQSIFGAGNYANVMRVGNDPDPQAGSTFVNIGGGFIGGSVYAGGHGHHDYEQPECSVFSIIEGDTHLTTTDGEFYNNPDVNRFYGEITNGLFGSGLTTSTVKGSTYLNINHSLYTSKFLTEAGFQPWSNKKGFERRFMYCGGGYGPDTDVMGDTHVLIDVKGAPDIETEMYSDGSGERGDITTKSILFMDVYGGGMSGDVYGSTNVTVKGNVFIRNLFGGGMTGDCGMRDKALNGDPFTPDNSERKYTTSSNVKVYSGGIGRLFGGGQMGDICGETFVRVGSADIEANRNILIEELYGGNDLTGSIAGGNNEKYGTNINLYGGTYLVVYGSGNGQSRDYDTPNSNKTLSLLGKQRPHVASASISVSGTDESHRTDIKEFLYCGGNTTTVGIFKLASNNKPEYDMLREELIPNSGRIRLNVGSHVKITNLVMGNNGRRLMEFAPSYTVNGKDWYHGFENDEDFRRYCRTVDISCVPELTFNKDGQFHNNYKIDDRMNTGMVFNTPGEMDASDIEIDTFVGGSHAGSMTCDSLYQYTLPTGLLITDKIVGGCMNSVFSYTQRQGPNKGTNFTFAGGMRPYRKMEEARKEQRIQLNVFCEFDPLRYRIDQAGNPSYIGTKIYGGCLDKGVIVGVAVVNLHSNMIDAPNDIDAAKLHEASTQWNSNAAQVYGGGKGERTEVIGDTYVSLSGATFNGKKCIPMVMRAFGGGENGDVIGRSNVYVNAQCPGSEPESSTDFNVWSGIYGGGLNGNVLNKSQYFPELPDAPKRGSHVRVWSGVIDQVFGGARNGNVEGASFVDIDDRGENHFHTIIRTLYGGNDLSGTIGHAEIPGINGSEPISTNTYVRVHAQKQPDGTYNGFPLIGEVYGGGNGEYGTYDKTTRTYTSGKIFTPNGQTLDITGLSLPNVDTTYVEVMGGTIWGLYGGANKSFVDKATTIDIHYNDDENALQEPCSFSRMSSAMCYQRGKFTANAFGAAGGVIDDGIAVKAESHIRYLFGGNKNSDMTIQPTWKLKSGNIHDLYGGCNLSDVHYLPSKDDDEGLLLNIESKNLFVDNVYGGCRLGNVWSKAAYGTIVKIQEGNIGRVFGGNDMTGYIENGTHLQIEGGIIQQVYGSGNGEYIYKYDKDAEKPFPSFDSEKNRFVCHIPISDEFGGENATPIQKVQAINHARPNIDRVMIEIGGLADENGRRRTVYISDAVYAGGNCATVVGKEEKMGDIQLQINDYSVINNVYLGSNGKSHIEREYLIDLLQANDVSVDDAQIRDEKGNSVLHYHMEGVAMHGLPNQFHFMRQYDRCYIGSFFVGGANSSISTHGSIDITFPHTLNIFNKIVGGSDRARVSIPVKSGVEFYDGGILWDGIGERPTINLDVQCRFLNREMVMEPRYRDSFYLRRLTEAEGIFNSGARVYGGCFLSGKVEGEVNVELSTEEEE